MTRLRTICLGLFFLVSWVPVQAEGFRSPRFLATGTSSLSFLTTPFNLPLSIEMNIGISPAPGAYIGVGADYWLAADAASDRLSYIGLIGEAGLFLSYPRWFWLLTAAVVYPATLSVQGSGSYSALAPPLSYRGRLLIGVRLTAPVSLLLGGGYRLQNLGSLVSGATPYNAGSLDMTGIFLSAGLAFTL